MVTHWPQTQTLTRNAQPVAKMPSVVEQQIQSPEQMTAEAPSAVIEQAPVRYPSPTYLYLWGKSGSIANSHLFLSTDRRSSNEHRLEPSWRS